MAVVTLNDVPVVNHTFKYEVLGRLSIENRSQYCARYGYHLISQAPIERDRPVCWAKIPAILDAMETHPWVLWADSDILASTHARSVDDFCDPSYDLIVQSHERFFGFLGIPLAEGLERMPINTGVFLMRASKWSREFLRRAYEQTEYVTQGHPWNGVGEQEAMVALLRRSSGDRWHIKYVDGLQNHPRFYRSSDRFVHFYGNYAKHHIPLDECAEVLGRWEVAIRNSDKFPSDIARFHWCCIQNKCEDAPMVRGDLSQYLYAPEDIVLPGARAARAL